MKELEKKELKQIQGGGAGLVIGIGSFIVGLVIFAIGIFDGYMNPKNCNG